MRERERERERERVQNVLYLDMHMLKNLGKENP